MTFLASFQTFPKLFFCFALKASLRKRLVAFDDGAVHFPVVFSWLFLDLRHGLRARQRPIIDTSWPH